MAGTDKGFLAGDVQLRVGGRTLNIHAEVPAREVPLEEMLPLFRGVTNALVSVDVADAEATGGQVSCRKGCGACCRQLVPVTLPEAVQLAALVDALPEPRNIEVRARFAAVVTRLVESGWYERWNELLKQPASLAKNYRDLGLAYFHLGTACPFLEDEACSIHPDRPLSCRQFLVTSDARHCSDPKAETVRTVAMSANMSRTLGSMAVEAGYGAAFLPLTLALALPDAAKATGRCRTGMAWAELLFKSLSGKELPPSTQSSPLMTG